MVIMVTGADGLVGRHIVYALLAQSIDRVIAISRHANRPAAGRLLWASADLRDAGDVAALENLQPDTIIHAAAVLPKSMADTETAASNLRIDANVIALARKSGAALIYLSSQSVYEHCHAPWTEVLPVTPTSSYASSKYQTEQRVLSLRQATAILRISSPYSAAFVERTNVLYHFVREAVANKYLQVRGLGTRTQDFIHASDIGRAVSLIVASWQGLDDEKKTGVFNIASGCPISMIGLAELVVRCCGSGKIAFAGDDPDASYRADMSISLAQEYLGWRPCVGLKIGVEQLIRRLRGADEDWFAI